MTTEKPAAAISTSDGARCYIAHFFAREIGRHDFATYIATELAADFACALAQHLATRQPGAQVPVGQVRTRVDGGFIAELFPGVADRVSNMAPLYAAPPAQGIDLHRLVPPEWLSEQLGGLIDDLTPGQAWRQGFNQCRARTLLLVEQAMGFPSEQQRDAAPGVGS